MVFIGMGVEAVGAVLVCMWIGNKLGEHFGWGVLGPAAGAFIGLIGWVIHLLMVAKALAKKEDSGDTRAD
jgi:hypothetical protein